MLRTFAAFLMGVYCHVVYTSDLRKLKIEIAGYPFSYVVQNVLNFQTFIILDVLCITLAEITQSEYDQKIKSLLSSN